MRSRLPVTASAVVVAMLLAGCGPADAPDEPGGAAPTSTTGSTSAPGDSVEDAPSTEPHEPGSVGSEGPTAREDHGTGGSPERGEPGTPPDPTSPGTTPPAAPPSTVPSPPTSDPTTPPGSGPTIVITTMGCSGTDSSERLKVQLTANYNHKYRKGVTAVWLTRPNNRGTGWIPQSTANWAGEYAGRGDRWSGELPTRTPSLDNYGYDREYGKVLKVRVRVDDGGIWEFEYPIERPC